MHFSKFGGESSGFRTQKRPFWKKIGISELRRRFKMSEFTAKKIKEARVRAGITQDEAATLIKIKKSTISDIESAKRNITADELAQFSRIYGTVSLNDEEWRFLENHSVNVGFSMDGYKELHDKNRGNSFDKAMHNVEEYKRVTGHYPTFNATVGEDSLLNADKRQEKQVPGQMNMFDYQNSNTTSNSQIVGPATNSELIQTSNSFDNATNETNAANGESFIDGNDNTGATRDVHPQEHPLPIVQVPVDNIQPETTGEQQSNDYEQLSFIEKIDRESIIKFVNEQGYLTYMVRFTKINSYLKSLLSLAGVLTQNMIYPEANDEIKTDVTNLIHSYIEKLREDGKYDSLVKQVMEMKLLIQVFDVFGEKVKNYPLEDYFASLESDLDRQLRAADAKLGGYGFPYAYGRRFLDFDNPNAFKLDCILFAADDECMKQLNSYAEMKFHELNDKYRKYVVAKSEKCRKQYSDIVADGDKVSKHNFTLPETISARIEKGGDAYTDHLYADEDGKAIIKLNNWEKAVIEEEEKKSDFVCWLRNQVRQSWSLCIPYEIDGEIKATYPDFIVVRKDDQLGYVIDILEPHNPEFKDNLGKAKGFAKYAEEEVRIGRIQLIRMSKDPAGKNRLKRLDLAKGSVRNKVMSAINNDELDHIFDTDGEFEE